MNDPLELFFTVEVLTTRGFIRYFVLFVIDLKTRRVEIAGISHQVGISPKMIG